MKMILNILILIYNMKCHVMNMKLSIHILEKVQCQVPSSSTAISISIFVLLFIFLFFLLLKMPYLYYYSIIFLKVRYTIILLKPLVLGFRLQLLGFTISLFVCSPLASTPVNWQTWVNWDMIMNIQTSPY